ncbi:alpha/beta hydrolase [Saccharopolyspora sp. K220]|uniref:alpha/beta hydrolase n=1 Tax=Saccharopolyspora soli TaxID=2926618 RepID=UPI001F59FEA1|nr:alpha/beta hydrolase [Saccharopolyspora soli]MCI2421062.1 alpha/beta hydrolase [Saccharopolyspora soli]
MATRESGPTLLLVHGAWHGRWAWEKLQPELAAAGWTTQAVQLPTAVAVKTPAEPIAGMHEDARVVRAAIDNIDGPVVVVAHSYGGIPVTQATAGAPNVTHAIYLAAFQLDVGESLYSFRGAPLPDSFEGTTPPPDHDSFYADLPADEAAQAAARLVPQSLRSFCETVTQAGWHTIASSYIICDQDRALPPHSQDELAARAGAVHHLDSSHSPMLSIPGELAALITKIADGRV